MELLQEFDHVQLEIIGYADSRGATSYNQKLSLKRAQSVESLLVKANISKDRLKVKALGESMLKNCTNIQTCDENEHAKNRRVDFVLSPTL